MLLECQDVHAAYGRSRVLHGLTHRMPAGKVSAIVGRNGMGKTTYAHTIMGFLQARSGSIMLDGKELVGRSPERVARAGISLVPQGRRVFASLTVGENLVVSHRRTAVSGAWDIDAVCERFPILRDRWNQGAGSLSGGQQQMLAIGRALLRNPRLIIMDEPSEGLDPERVAAVRAVIEELRERGTAVLLIEQKVQLVLDVADSIAVIARGEIVHESAVEAHRASPELLASHLGFG